MKPAKLFQPGYFKDFRCIGADCEDTCCVGWMVRVDKVTYDKYQSCSDPELAPALHRLVTINEKDPKDDDYAKITLQGSTCPFLSEGLCSIQHRLGEEYLSNTCATYPRVINRVDDVLYRSLDLSCPEAARVALLNPNPMEFAEEDYAEGSIRLGDFPSLDTSSLGEFPEPYPFFRGVRRLVISLLQNRSYPIWKRLFLLGCVCEKLDEAGGQIEGGNILDEIQKYLDSVENGIAGDLSTQCLLAPAARLEVVLELVVARITADFNPRRFLECYEEFMKGVEWTSQSTMEQIGVCYSAAYSQYYAPFMSRHEHILEHYLVNYAHRTLFPFGLPEANERLHKYRVPSAIGGQFMLMIAYYAITQTLFIGMAGFHKSGFGVEHVIKLVQSCTKTFEHSLTYPGRVIEMLAEKRMTTPMSLCGLIRDRSRQDPA